jgi:hypothetical protein
MWNEDAHISGLINPFFIWFYFLEVDVMWRWHRPGLLCWWPQLRDGTNEIITTVRPFVRSSVRLYRVGPAHMADNLGRCIDNSRRRDQRFKNVRGNKPTTAPNGGTWIFPTKTFRDSRTNASPLFSCTTDTCDRNVPSKNHRPVLRLVQAPFELNIQWKLVRTCYYVRIEYQRNIWCSRFSPERE